MKHEKRGTAQTIEEGHLEILGVKSTDEINGWYIKAQKDLYRLDGIDEADRILNEDKNRPIRIMGDYDVDGIMATSIVFRSLKWRGFTNVSCRQPYRFTEGFGMNPMMVDEITDSNTVIITVDNGIAALGPVAYAKEKGYTVIVTDHHEPVVDKNGKAILPDADVVIDPVAIPGSADFNGYCGAGIAFKLARALLKGDPRIRLLYPLVALATIADHVPLREENYYFARKGLGDCNKGEEFLLPGVAALIRRNNLQYVDADAAGYTLNPSINAPERVANGEARKGVELFTEDDPDECDRLADQLYQYNDERKRLVKAAFEKVADELREQEGSCPLIIYIPGISEGIIGIIAGDLLKRYGVPAAVFSDSDEEGFLKGSFRSNDNYNVKEHLDSCQDLFVKCGGHEKAGGATVRKKDFNAMRVAMSAHAKKTASYGAGTLYYDVEIDSADLADAVARNERFQPFGEGNRNLIYKITGFKIIPLKYKGDAKQQIGNGGLRIRSKEGFAVGFGLWHLGEGITFGSTVTLYGTISYNRYNGSVTPQIIFDDLEIEK